MTREPIFKPGGLIVVVSCAATLIIVVAARSLGWQTSVLGVLGVLFATHAISGVARVLLVYRDQRKADWEAQEQARLWRQSQPDPLCQDEPKSASVSWLNSGAPIFVVRSGAICS